MRKLILILFIILSCASLANSGGIISFPGGGAGGVVCVKDTTTLVMDETAFDVDTDQDLNPTDAIGQSISYSGSNWDLYSIEIQCYGPTCNGCQVELRIGTSSNLATTTEPYEVWATANLGDGGLVEVLSVDNDTFTDGTTYYIGMVEVNATACGLAAETTAGSYAGGENLITGASGWQLGTTQGRDYHINVYKCQ